ncbi:restriction endonuclease, partial [Vibrio parahaemolyticus]|nr:restriction endonuclease [Vibrio parahaemolyticus]
MTPNLLKRFIDSNNYDIRRTNNARWIDQKCAFDSICFVADCIIEYYRNQNMDTFFSPNIWKSEYAIKNVQLWFGKPDPLDISTMDEYNKFFRQPMK